MNAKEYLSQAYMLNELIESNNLELAQLNEIKLNLPGTDYSKDRVQTSSSNNARYTQIVEKITDLEKVIQEDTSEMLSLKLQIRKVISSVKDNEERLVLKLRYLNFLHWEDVADGMGVSRRTAQRIHDRIIEKIVIPTNQ